MNRQKRHFKGKIPPTHRFGMHRALNIQFTSPNGAFAEKFEKNKVLWLDISLALLIFALVI
jgi:hypothetical protein